MSEAIFSQPELSGISEMGRAFTPELARTGALSPEPLPLELLELPESPPLLELCTTYAPAPSRPPAAAPVARIEPPVKVAPKMAAPPPARARPPPSTRPHGSRMMHAAVPTTAAPIPIQHQKPHWPLGSVPLRGSFDTYEYGVPVCDTIGSRVRNWAVAGS